MSWRQTEAMTSLRSVEDDPLSFEGIAVPYGQVTSSAVREYGKPEAFAPGSFAKDVEYWMGRKDGAKLAYRPEHGAKPVGTAQMLSDTPAGVAFRVKLYDTPSGNEYADQVGHGCAGHEQAACSFGKTE